MKRYQQVSDRDRQFTRRALIVGGGQGVLLAGLVARMYYLQVTEADQYRTLAEENRISMRLLPPLRGTIVDRNGRELAGNKLDYRVILVPEQMTDFKRTLQDLQAYLNLSERTVKRISDQVKRQRSFLPITVADNLSWEEFAGVNVHLADLPGVHPDAGETRDYYEGTAFVHVVGYVSPVTKRDLQASEDPLLELPGFKMGRSGIERTFDLSLRGAAGNSRTEVNAYGRTIRELARKDGEPGGDIKLSLDADLQTYAVKRMGEHSGATVLMDIHSGDILAYASTPAYDPSDFNVGISQKNWDALLDNIRTPLVNKVIGGLYPPGSTFKMIVGLAALEEGIVTPDDTFFCNGKVKLGNLEFHCWKDEGHGNMNLYQAIQQSCDTYFYQVARRLGIEKIAAMARRFGLGEVHDIDLAGQRSGLVPDDAWKRAARGEGWQGGDNLNAGIGQGFLLVTPLQLAVMTSRIANGGLAVEPRLILPDDETPVERALPMGVNPGHLRSIREAMNAVSNTQRGTGFAARIRNMPYTIAGKSGTAQVRRITRAERESGVIKNEDLDWKQRDHALFTAFAPVENPRFAIAVVIEHGGGGSSVAGPVARDIMAEALKLHMPGGEVAAVTGEGSDT